MLKKYSKKIYNSSHHINSGNYFYLLVSLLSILLLPVIMKVIPFYPKLVYTIVFNGMLLVGLYICTTSKRDLLSGLSLGFLAWLFLWVDFATHNISSTLLSHGTLMLFYCYLAYHLFKSLKEYKKLSKNIIYAAISGFLMLGFMGAQIIYILDGFEPNSFSNLGDSIYNPIYMSFVSLTTLGYGDIIPLTDAAKSLAIFLGIVGQMYITIIVGIMVGKYIKN